MILENQVALGQVLFAGGSGFVGRNAVRWFRESHPSVRVLVGGRNLQSAGEVAQEVGTAEAVAIDLDKPHLGLGDDVTVAAVVMLAPEAGLKGLSYAQDLGIPYLNINAALTEIGPELAMFAHRAAAAPVVLASHWMAGAAVFLALNSVKGFEVIHSIQIGAILDENDPAGPASLEDMERVHGAAPSAMVFEGGRRVWLSGDAAKGKIESIDGRSLDATAFSTFDIASLHAATGAPNVRFDLVTDKSSSRHRGGEAATEIVVEIEGEVDGRTQRSRSMLEFKYGAASLTGLSVVLSLVSVLGLNDRAPARPGLYLPELLSDTEWFLNELRRAGATIHGDSKPTLQF
ncbi:NAD(P)-dependent oxidoreductase [Nodosilinea sp. LEGE 06152]|uniref:NAD(P)-dependent oxidoreductase n=1 Tax=Nodosilinea sp. LEGE 06152 TaxID=2777966 RepID=UPI00187E6832|nr:NAD(P)-dependent oxidoreductase [Nodosilinea sp. LEGE 06152]MBE9160213.1 NAD(P)-dependent oxidoreductase [Nodosilinea sp. LEGE 06152]